jgi:integrase
VKGSTFRRCHCRDENGKLLSGACPKLKQKRHGTHSVRQELPPREDGKRRSFTRGGYDSAAKAQADLDKIRALLAIPAEGDSEGRTRIADLLEKVAKEKLPIPEAEETRRKLKGGVDLRSDMTVADWLDAWLASKKTRKTTTNGYASHIKVHLKPRLGHLPLDRLNVGHVQAMFDAIKDENDVITAENAARREQVARCKPGKVGAPTTQERKRLLAERAKLAQMKPFRKVTNAATRQRIRATLRTALNAAIARQLITFNAAEHVELDSGKRPKALLWTDQHVARWKRTGEIPSAVMVWTPQQLGQFLDVAEGHRLYAIYHLIAFRGLRRGEAVGQDWVKVNLDRAELTVSREIVVDGWTPYESDPKTDGSAATIHLDSATVAVLRAHRARQNKERLKWGEAWKDTGKVFTQEDGSWLHPDTVSREFDRLVSAAGLPPINLRDLRHVAATLIHAAGGDLHTIKETLRHATIMLTSDTYTSLLPDVDREVSEKVAQLVPRTRAEAAGDTSAPAMLPQTGAKAAEPQPLKLRRIVPTQVNRGIPADPFSGPSGARTLNQWIKRRQDSVPDGDE